ncbi:DNA polymerase III subunit gamma and tau [Agromyces sp. Marseille-P2726]|uniref:DNA polymerase III subunit gamma and tau n=1 Tax=Agromyces sp. Marseille-P2726 TaxID=2709132 RepID=UPI00156F7A0C|nr:DNA polymerase III subunit gamma and tau [Agromyces sp. Marseille-P2726]
MVTALYRRYRPETFAEMIGQSQVTEPLMTALRTDRVNHAYLFSGPRGCGKTTSARILARCLNCVEGPTDVPCGTCPSCVELSRGGGGSLDVVEIDAASHNGVDDARDLRERAVFAPARDRYKIFILDEAHMVTPQGFNALLKLVEEPPEHVKFIFATTEPDKVLGTIRSRTHHYPFRLVPPGPMLEYVQQLCAEEGVEVAPGVLPLVVRAGGGSPRDTLSLLDQLMAGSEGSTIDYERAVALLGYTHGALLDEVVDAIGARDAAGAFAAADRVVQTGQDPRRFVEDLLERLRDLIVVAASSPEAAAAVLRGVPEDELARMATQAAAFGSAELSRVADLVNQTLTEMTGATSPRLHLELMLARVLVPSSDDTERGALARVERLERRVGVSDAAADAGGREALGAESGGRVAPPEATSGGRVAPRDSATRIETTSAADAEPGLDTGAASPRPTRPTEAAAPGGGRVAPPEATSGGRVAPRDSATRIETPSVADAEPGLDTRPAAPGATRPTEAAAPGATRPAEAASAGGARPAERPVGPVTVQLIRDAWPEILGVLERTKRSAWIAAMTAKVIDYRSDESVLVLGFPSQNDVQDLRGGTGPQKPADLLRAAIADVLGVQVKFLPRVIGSQAGEAEPPARPSASEPATPRPSTPATPPSASVVDSWTTVAIPTDDPATPEAPASSSGNGSPGGSPQRQASSARTATALADAPAAASDLEAVPDEVDAPPADDVEPPFDPGPVPEVIAQTPAATARPRSAASVDGGIQRYGEAVVREVLGATFLEEVEAPGGPGFGERG